jgi:hypothetical protein
VLGAQVGEHVGRRPVDHDAVHGEEGVQRFDDPGIGGQRASHVARAGERFEGGARIVVPQDIEAQEGAVDRLACRQARSGRLLAALQRRQAPPGGRVEARAVLPGQGVGARGGQRRQEGTVDLDRALAQRLGDGAGSGTQHPPAAPVVAGRRDATDPASFDGGQPGVDLWAGRQFREPVEHLSHVHAGPVVHRRPPLALVPIEASLGDRPHDGHDVGVVREGEYDDQTATVAAAQLDVGAFVDELHASSR